MSSKPTAPEDPLAPPPDAPPAPRPAAGEPHRQRELAEPAPDERPEHFVEVDGRLVPEGDLVPTLPIRIR